MNRHAKALGKLGGKVKSEAKTAAVRENGKLGGRPAGCSECRNSIKPGLRAFCTICKVSFCFKCWNKHYDSKVCGISDAKVINIL